MTNTTDFIVAMNAIDKFYHKHKRYNEECWLLIDTLPNRLVHEWVERLFIKRVFEGKEYIKIVGICSQYKTQKFLSVKQKRLLALKILENWDTLSIDYETV